MTKCINIKVSKFWMTKNKYNKLILSRWKKSVLNIKLINPKYGELFGYNSNDCLAIIFSQDDGNVAVLNFNDDKHWQILFRQPEYFDNSGIPTNAAIFKLTGVTEKYKFLWVRVFGEERILRYSGLFNKLSFSKKNGKEAGMHIYNI